MMSKSIPFVCRTRTVLLAMAVFAGWTSLPAQARVSFGVGIGIPLYGPGYYPPPIYYPPPPPIYYAPPPPIYYPLPPVYYTPPPPVYYTPPQQSYVPPPAGAVTGSGAGQACYAGAYVCPMDRPVATGAGCYCSGNSGQRVLGRAN